MPRGQGQAIVKYERMEADTAFDPAGVEQPLQALRRDDALALHAEYGVADRLSVQLKAEVQSGEDAFVDYEGRGPIELGLTWQVHRGAAGAVSAYVGYAQAGVGRNAGYAPPGVGEHDWEARVAAGRSWGPARGLDGVFVEAQAARRLRDQLPDETRLDATAGARFAGRWMALAQAYGGAADAGARWLSVEASLVRDAGDWSLQAGWRRTVAGRETPISSGPIVAVWRRF